MANTNESGSAVDPFDNTKTVIINPAALVGKTLGGCELLGVLEAGAMGVVYDARHVELDREVVVKVPLPSEEHLTEAASKRFTSEARLAAKLSHSNIVRIYNAGTQGDIRFIEMEKITGPDLAKYVEEKGTLPAEEAIRIAKALASALAYAHDKGIIHRDIKPQNILMDGDVPKLADFGLAKALGPEAGAVMASAVSGTPGYMSPEQCNAVELDPRTDIYALGEIMYFMFTGANPFEGKTASEVLRKHVKGDYTPLIERCPDIDRRLVAVVEKMMAAAPGDRYQTGEEVLSALDAVSRGTRSAFSVRYIGTGIGIAVVVALVWLGLRNDEERTTSTEPASAKASSADAKPNRTTPGPLKLDVKLEGQTRDESGKVKTFVMQEGDSLRSGDNFRVKVKPGGRAYVYVLHCDATGQPTQLFPEPGTEKPTPVTEKQEVALPDSMKWYGLDEVPGTEVVYVLASETPLDRVEWLLKVMEEAHQERGIKGVVPDMREAQKRIAAVTEAVRKVCPNMQVVSFKHEEGPK